LIEQLNQVLVGGDHFLGLLGIHFAQFSIRMDLESDNASRRQAPHSAPLILEGAYVEGLSGMTCVLPAWSILEVLNLPKLTAERAYYDDLEEERRRHIGVPKAEMPGD
jgi:hypothetical protein